jgi:hypothetical protein
MKKHIRDRSVQRADDQVERKRAQGSKAARGFTRWTGLRGKTLWDWLQILIIPAALAIGAFYIDIVASYIANDRQREEAMKDYFHEMTTLLLEHKLRQADKESEVRMIARVSTITTLRKMDEARKGFIMMFLSEAKLISRDDPVVSLSGANLRNADLTGINLSNTALHNVYLHGAILDHTGFRDADLTNAVLTEATVRNSNLMDALLCHTYLPDGTENNRDCPDANP